MSKRAFSRSFDMPTIDPDKEDETPEIEKRKDTAYKKIVASYMKPEKGDCDNAFEKATGKLIRKWLGERFEDLEDVYKPEYDCPVIEAAKSGCDHSWASYTGLSESFEFCKHCDEKR